jgi:hypothetical protein
MRLFREIQGAEIQERSSFELRTYKNETGKAKHNRRAKLQHITESKPLEFMAIAKRESFKESRRESQREERRAKRK